MKKVYYLSTCDTCKRIIKELDIGDEFEYQDIKHEKITVAQLDKMKKLAGSYEALFSRTARKYKELGLKDKQLTESESLENYYRRTAFKNACADKQLKTATDLEVKQQITLCTLRPALCAVKSPYPNQTAQDNPLRALLPFRLMIRR